MLQHWPKYYVRDENVLLNETLSSDIGNLTTAMVALLNWKPDVKADWNRAS